MDESMKKFYSDVYTRVKERIGSMGLSDAAQEAKLAKYATLFEGEDPRLSAISIQNIATDLMTTYHWVISGEHDDTELQMTVRNVLKDEDDTGGNPDWIVAEEALRDAAMAYLQVAPYRKPLPSFAGLQAGKVDAAFDEMKKAFDADPELDVFYAVEEYFGVDIILIKSEHPFDAVGGKVGDFPFIVANSKHSVARVYYAVACELAMIVHDYLALYSDVFAEDFPENSAIGDFMDRFIEVARFNENANGYGRFSDETRFPAGLIEAHRNAVASHGNLGFFLEWMTGEKRVQEDLSPTNVEDLVDWFGFKD